MAVARYQLVVYPSEMNLPSTAETGSTATFFITSYARERVRELLRNRLELSLSEASSLFGSFRRHFVIDL
jgi:hypothetical protein